MQDTTDLLAPADSTERHDPAGSATSASHTITTLPIEYGDSPAASDQAAPGQAEDSAGPRARRTRSAGGSLTTKTLAELQAIAAAAGVVGTAKLRKGQLIIAIQAAQGGGSGTGDTAAQADGPAVSEAPAAASNGHAAESVATSNGHAESAVDAPANGHATAEHSTAEQAGTTESTEAGGDATTGEGRDRPRNRGPRDQAEGEAPREGRERYDRGDRQQNGQNGQGGDRQQGDRPQGDRPPRDRNRNRGGQNVDGQNRDGQNNQGERQPGDRPQNDRPNRDGNQNRDNQNRDQSRDTNQNRDRNNGPDAGDDEDGRGRRGRYRDRRNRQGRNREGGGLGEAEPVINEDDVLVPVAGIVDILDNYAFVRTSGYLAGPNDVYVSLAQVRRYGLRRGDAVTGAVKQRAEGQNSGDSKRDKFNALVRLDTVNGLDPEASGKRPDFSKLVPLYPQDRLRLETEPHILTTRVIDIVAPLGKGQRALIVSPPKAGKTMVLQAIANAITTNNPECHLMVVLVDERPEEVTDMQRSVKGEVIASTFDRHPADHITVAELSIERAKRLVEMGHDVVVLLDSITRLGRAYNLAAPASGRILSGGVDSAALYPPKRFLGAARNIEKGGSLTIIATALVETGSAMDTVIFEEFKGTGNSELKLDRRLADKRIFPAIDIDPSGTRKEELLLSREELSIVVRLRRVLHALEGGQQGIELLLEKLRETKSNTEFLLQIQKTMPGAE